MKKIITTIVITIIFGIIFLLYASGILISLGESKVSFLFLWIVLMAFMGLIGALVYNMYRRIKEIKEEEKDDISKY